MNNYQDLLKNTYTPQQPYGYPPPQQPYGYPPPQQPYGYPGGYPPQAQSNNAKESSIVDEVYTGTAKAGVAFSLIGAVTSTIFAIILISIGIYLLVRKTTNYISAEGQIVAVNGCTTTTSSSRTSFCNLTVSYTYNNKQYTSTVQGQNNIIYVVNQNITVYFTSDNPTKIQLSGDVPNWVGWILIIVGIVVAIVGWVWYYLSSKYKVVAAIGGARGIYDIIRN
jgi:hypothetical protein